MLRCEERVASCASGRGRASSSSSVPHTRAERENLVPPAAWPTHLSEVIEWKRDHLADDVVSAVIVAGDAGEVMRREQVVPFVHTLYLAGMHTTVNQTALGLLALLEHRDQWELLQRNRRCSRTRSRRCCATSPLRNT